MRQISRLVLSAALLTLLAATAFPQKRLCPKPPPSPYKHDGEIVTSFDSRAGGMRTTLEHPRAMGQGAELYYLAASFMHQNTKRPGTPALELVLYTTSPAALPQGGGVSLVLDGQARPFAQHAGFRSQPGRGNAVRLTLSYAELSALTRARNASVRLGGGAQLHLTHNHLESLREMLSLLAPSPGRWQTADAQAR